MLNNGGCFAGRCLRRWLKHREAVKKCYPVCRIFITRQTNNESKMPTVGSNKICWASQRGRL